MTVGIAAIAENDGDPYAIVSADRMITIGQGDGVEYEDTESKIETFIHNDQLCAVAVGSGPSNYLDEVFRTLHSVVANQRQPPTTIEGAMNCCLGASQAVVRDSISNQVLSPLGYTLDDFQDESMSMPAEIQRSVMEQIANLREGIRNGVQILVAGVGKNGAGIYLISGAEYSNYSQTGYGIIGSGSRSARLTFIRRRYDRDCSMRDGVFTVLEAKSRSEERQGVGQRMDMKLVQPGRIRTLDETEIEELRNKLTEIEEAEKDARESVMSGWTL